MPSPETHFEVVHSGPRRFHGRLQHPNGKFSWWTEEYVTRKGCYDSIALLPGFQGFEGVEPGDDPDAPPERVAVFVGARVSVYEVEDAE